MIGFLLFLLTPLAWVLVPICALFKRYPAWLLTPDDPVSPFGQYEPTVRAVYAKYGRWAGDVYWLAFRNVWYGLAYRLKPEELKGVLDYSTFTWAKIAIGRTERTAVELDFMSDRTVIVETIRRRWGLALIKGYRCSPIANRLPEHGPLRHPNMDGRPIFSIRLERNA